MKGKKFARRTPEMVGILKKEEVSLRQIKFKDFVCFSLRKKMELICIVNICPEVPTCNFQIFTIRIRTV